LAVPPGLGVVNPAWAEVPSVRPAGVVICAVLTSVPLQAVGGIAASMT
jgi:hypothetical protein